MWAYKEQQLKDNNGFCIRETLVFVKEDVGFNKENLSFPGGTKVLSRKPEVKQASTGSN